MADPMLTVELLTDLSLQPAKHHGMQLYDLCASTGGRAIRRCEQPYADASRPPQASPLIRVRWRVITPRTGSVAGLCFPKHDRIEMHDHPHAGSRLVSSRIACTDTTCDEVVSPPTSAHRPHDQCPCRMLGHGR